MTEEMRIDGASKKTFVLTMRNMDTILDLDPKSPFKEDADDNEQLILYKQMNSSVVSILKITKQ